MIILINNLSRGVCCICLVSFDHIRKHRVINSYTEECFLLLSIHFHFVYFFLCGWRMQDSSLYCCSSGTEFWAYGIQIICSVSWLLRPYENPGFLKQVSRIVLACERSQIMSFSNCYAVFWCWTVGRDRGLLPWLHVSKLFCITNTSYG